MFNTGFWDELSPESLWRCAGFLGLSESIPGYWDSWCLKLRDLAQVGAQSDNTRGCDTGFVTKLDTKIKIVEGRDPAAKVLNSAQTSGFVSWEKIWWVYAFCWMMHWNINKIAVTFKYERHHQIIRYTVNEQSEWLSSFNPLYAYLERQLYSKVSNKNREG